MQIRKLSINEEPPMELLLLADPSSDLVKDYVKRGECFVAEKEQEMIGSYVLLPTRPETVELVNIAVAESKQGNGIGKLLVREQKNKVIKQWKLALGILVLVN